MLSDYESDSLPDTWAECYQNLQSQVLKRMINRYKNRDDLQHPYDTGRNGPPHVFTEYTPDTTLLDNSDFARMTSGKLQADLKKKPSNIVNILMNREKGQFSSNDKWDICNRYVPNKFDILVGYAGRIYCSTFTRNGQYFLTASDDKKLKIYNSGDGSYNIKKSMVAKHVKFSIADLECHPDNIHFVYTTQSSLTMCLCRLTDGYNEQVPLVVDYDQPLIRITSVSFSADGKELLCSSNDGNIYIYDLENHRTTLTFLGHTFNANSVAFADYSSNILYSAGDDGIVKLWDRRTSSRNDPTPVGYLEGHRQGIMYMDLRGDGRHLITHSEDQSIKLWDVRLLASDTGVNQSLKFLTNALDNLNSVWNDEPRMVPGDTSIMTYRGHTVRNTVIKCRFSPVETTGQRYIYTGCDSGRVVVYDALTGRVVQNQVGHVSCVCNVSWHPTRNEMLSSGMDGLVGIWTYMEPDNIMQPEQMEIDRKHFSSYKFEDKLLLDPARKCHILV